MSYKIHQFNPAVYPRKLWVLKGGKSEMIKEHFTNTDKSEMDIQEEIGDGFDGMVFQVKFKDNGCLGSLVWIADSVDVGEVAHEASHVAMDILSDIGYKLDPLNQEPLSYMIGWVADCIWQVKTGKFKEPTTTKLKI